MSRNGSPEHAGHTRSDPSVAERINYQFRLILLLLGTALVGESIFGLIYYLLPSRGPNLWIFVIGFGLSWILAPTIITVLILKGLIALDREKDENAEIHDNVPEKRMPLFDLERMGVNYVGMALMACVTLVAAFLAVLCAQASGAPGGGMDLLFFLSLPLSGIAAVSPAIVWISLAGAFKPSAPLKIGVIAGALAWGMASTQPSLFFNTVYGSLLAAVMGMDLTAVLSAPIVEEFFKAFGIVLFLRYIRDESDGALLGLCFGAGFNIIESLIYAYNGFWDASASMIALQLGERGVSMTIHLFGPMVIGTTVGYVKHRGLGWMIGSYGYRSGSLYHLFLSIGVIAGAYLLAMFYHGLWNSLAMATAFIHPIIALGNLLQSFLGLFIVAGILLVAGILSNPPKTKKKERDTAKRQGIARDREPGSAT